MASAILKYSCGEQTAAFEDIAVHVKEPNEMLESDQKPL